MKVKVTIIAAILLATFFWLFWPRGYRQSQNTSSSPDVAAEGESEPIAALNTKSDGVNSLGVSTAPITVSRVNPVNVGVTPAIVDGLPVLVPDDWSAPISFYGQVVDQDTNALAEATVQFTWDESPMDSGQKSATAVSNTNGLFSLHGAHGRILSVAVSKSDYYMPHPNSRSFHYSMRPDVFSPDPLKPVVFRLHKKGEAEPLIRVSQNFRVPKDGSPVTVDLRSGTLVASSADYLVVECWNEAKEKRTPKKYNWSCRMSIPGGSVMIYNDEFSFLAPQDGYLPYAEIKMTTNRLDWKRESSFMLFYRVPSGNYGRMHFQIIAGGDHFAIVDSYLNPSGSRNLEYNEAVQPKPAVHE